MNLHIVVRGTSVTDTIFPVDNVSYGRGKSGGWEKEKLFPDRTASGQILELQVGLKIR